MPSHTPEAAADYSNASFRDDAIAMLDHLKIAAAHSSGRRWAPIRRCRSVCTSLQVGLHTPRQVLTLAGVGSGFETERLEGFRAQCLDQALAFDGKDNRAGAA